MGPLVQFLFFLVLFAVLSPSPSEGVRNTRYISYYSYNNYRGYYRYSNIDSTPSNTNGTACGSSCIAGSVFTTIASQPCLICCFIVLGYFICKCSCAACNGICKSPRSSRLDNSDQLPAIERTRHIRSCRMRDRCMSDVIVMTVTEDTPPPYSPEMEKLKCQPDKVMEEKPPEYEDIYSPEAYPAQH